jgi:hypothetical protein
MKIIILSVRKRLQDKFSKFRDINWMDVVEADKCVRVVLNVFFGGMLTCMIYYLLYSEFLPAGE